MPETPSASTRQLAEQLSRPKPEGTNATPICGRNTSQLSKLENSDCPSSARFTSIRGVVATASEGEKERQLDHGNSERNLESSDRSGFYSLPVLFQSSNG